jgi:hypothetical protein
MNYEDMNFFLSLKPERITFPLLIGRPVDIR